MCMKHPLSKYNKPCENEPSDHDHACGAATVSGTNFFQQDFIGGRAQKSRVNKAKMCHNMFHMLSLYIVIIDMGNLEGDKNSKIEKKNSAQKRNNWHSERVKRQPWETCTNKQVDQKIGYANKISRQELHISLFKRTRAMLSCANASDAELCEREQR